MEIVLERNSKRCFRKLMEQEQSCDTSAECVVPDTQEDIRQILGVSFVTRLRSKSLEPGDISFKAELSATVMYYSDKGVETLNMTLPLCARFPSGDADSSCRLSADMRICSWDARLINPRKLSLSANASVSIQCYKENELVWYGEPSAMQEKLFIKSESRDVMLTDTVTEKEITVAEDFELPLEENVRLISAAAEYHTEGSETVGDRLIVRCRADIEAIFLRDGSLTRETISLPFSQLFDVDGSGEGCPYLSCVSTGEYYEYSDGKLSVELHTALQLVYCKSETVQYASDAYSCTNELNSRFESAELCSALTECSAKKSVQLSLEPTQGIAELVMTRAKVSRLERTNEGISAAVAAEIIYRDSENELRCGRVRGSVQFAEAENVSRIISCELLSVKTAVNGSSVDFNAELNLNILQEQHCELVLLTGIDIGDELNGSLHSAYIVMSEAEPWDIAKKYRSAAASIIEISASDGGKRKYFVPVIT